MKSIGTVIIWLLVVEPPLWKICSSIGMMTFPTEWRNKTCSSHHQPDDLPWHHGYLTKLTWGFFLKPSWLSMIEPSIEGCRKARPCSLGVPSSAAYASAKKRHQANMITKMRCSKAYCISLSKSCRGVHCGTPISTRLTANPIWQPLATTLILPYPYLRFQIEFVSIICFFHAGSLH